MFGKKAVREREIRSLIRRSLQQSKKQQKPVVRHLGPGIYEQLVQSHNFRFVLRCTLPFNMTTSDDLAQPPLPPGSGVGSPVKIEPNYIPHPKDTLKSKGSAPSASSSPSSSQPSSSAASTATTPSTIPSAKATKPKPRYTGSDVDVNAQPLLSAGPVLVPIKKFDNDSTNGRWSKEEDALLRLAVDKLGAKNWKRVSAEFLKGTRTDVQCLHRWQKVLKPGLVKGPWTKEEDDTIINCRKRGITKWSEIAQHVTGRIGKQCRERWFNHLDPDIRRCEWTEEEDRKLIEGQALLGNKWTQIAKLFLPGRPENAVKNRWNAATRRRIGTKKKLQIENINKVGAQSNGGVNKKPQVKKKMRPYTKTQGKRRLTVVFIGAICLLMIFALRSKVSSDPSNARL